MAVVSSSCPVKYQEATASLDYLPLPSETTIVVLSAQARQHSLNNQLLPDTMPEGTEAFCLSVFRDVESPMFFQSIAQTSVVIVDDDSKS